MSDRLIGFVATSNAERARAFYTDVLGLEFLGDDGFALVLRSGANMVRIAKVETVQAAPHTVMGWQCEDIVIRARKLAAAGVEFSRFPWFEQDSLGIWTAPNGDQVAWFQDPDGNVLSLSQHVSG